MTHEQLIAFLAVASAGTFSAASAQLHKSQPAISKLVRNLEDELGLLLFDREGYRPKLTEAGQQFCERAAVVVASTESLRSLGLALAKRVEPVVRLVIEAIAPLVPIMSVLRAVQSLHPSVRFELRTERLAGAVEALKDGSADLVVSTKRGIDPRLVELQHFVAVRILPVVRRDHPLARAGIPVPAALLRQYPQVVLRDSARGELPQNVNVLEAGLRWTVTDIAAKLEIIQAGMGWGGLPEHVVAKALRSRSLVILNVREFDVDVLELFSMRRRDRPAGIAAQALWSRLAPAEELEAGRVRPTPKQGDPAAPPKARRQGVRGRPGGRVPGPQGRG